MKVILRHAYYQNRKIILKKIATINCQPFIAIRNRVIPEPARHYSYRILMDGTCLVVRQGLGHWYIYLASLKFIFAHAIEKFQPSAISHWTREGWLECAGEVIFKPYLHSKESISQSYRRNPWIREVTAKGKILIEVDEVSYSIIHRYRHSKVRKLLIYFISVLLHIPVQQQQQIVS